MHWCIVWHFNNGRQIEPYIDYNYCDILIKAVTLQLIRSSYAGVPFTLEQRIP